MDEEEEEEDNTDDAGEEEDCYHTANDNRIVPDESVLVESLDSKSINKPY